MKQRRGKMQVNQFNHNLYVLSAEKITNSKQLNDYRTIMLRNNLQRCNVPFTECEGRYKGVKEVSFILTDSNRMTAHHLAMRYFQDCFLELVPYVGNSYRANSVDTNTGQQETLGIFRSTDLPGSRDYTKDSNGTYFIIESEGV
jgi:hypothetical protein